MLGRRKLTCAQPGLWEYPRTGFWVIHALGIAAVFYLGYKCGQDDDLDCQ